MVTSPTIRELKRKLRENAVTGKAYHGLAVAVQRVQRQAFRIRFGRAYPAEYFDREFARDADPWSYEGDLISEERKSLLLSLLPTHVRRLLEVGCAAGWMTPELAVRADLLEAVEISPVALSLAEKRCEGIANVRFSKLDLLTERPQGTFGAIICAGVLIFLPWRSQVEVRDRIVKALDPGGHLLLEHVRESFPGQLAGGLVHELYASHPDLLVVEVQRRDIYEVMLLKRHL